MSNELGRSAYAHITQLRLDWSRLIGRLIEKLGGRERGGTNRLAQAVGCCRSTVSYWSVSDSPKPTGDFAIRLYELAMLLGVELPAEGE